jgi:hypothetical protein
MLQKAERLLGVLLLLSISPTVRAAEEAPIMLTNSDKIADAMALNEAIDQVSAKVMQCMQQGPATEEKCLCRYSAEVQKVKDKYEIALKRNPEWKDRTVFWTIKGALSSYTLAFARIRRQVETKCNTDDRGNGSQ